MKPILTGAVLCLLAVAPTSVPSAPATPNSRDALQAFQDLIGAWRGTGMTYGTREQRDKGTWQETIAWQWRFKGADVWLQADLDKGKWFTRWELRYLPAQAVYQLKAWTVGKEEQTFTGNLEKRRLTVSRVDPPTGHTQQLVISLLHSNRYLYRCEEKSASSSLFTPVYQVGATKQGVAFASAADKPECIVSGGLGTIAVTFKGKTYHVCCSGCRDAFKEEPEKYIQEFEARKKEKK